MSQALAGKLAKVWHCGSAVTVFPGSHPVQQQHGHFIAKESLWAKLGLCRPSSVVPRRVWKYEHLQFDVLLRLLSSLSVVQHSAIQGSCTISCESYYLRKMKGLALYKFRIKLQAKLMMTVFAENKNIYQLIKYTNMHLKLEAA